MNSNCSEAGPVSSTRGASFNRHVDSPRFGKTIPMTSLPTQRHAVHKHLSIDGLRNSLTTASRLAHGMR